MTQRNGAKKCLVTYAALMVLLGLTFGLNGVDLNHWAFPLALMIATIKAGLVLGVFMELATSSRLIKTIAFGAAFWIILMYALIFSDFGMRAYHAL